MPIGWGPYTIEEWKTGDHITLRKNENYFRNAERLPVFDHLVYRFVGENQEGLAGLLAGECDILDESALRGASQEELTGLQEAGRVKVEVEPDTAWEQRAASLDPGYARAHMLLGAALDLKGDYLTTPELSERALASLDRALALRPDSAEACGTAAARSSP